MYLERLAKVDTIVFDKTGTLTVGVPERVGIVVHDTALSEDDVLRYAASADLRSGHPLATAVVKAARARGVQIPEVQDFQSIQGRGVTGVVEAREVMVGNEALMDEHGVTGAEAEDPHVGSTVQVAVNGQRAASLRFADQTRPGTADVIQRLRADGVKRFVMLTGDNAAAAQGVADVSVRPDHVSISQLLSDAPVGPRGGQGGCRECAGHERSPSWRADRIGVSTMRDGSSRRGTRVANP